ncbi:TonB-dependent receptor [Marivirga sp.]|uniref:SusC/RagA family TonB-linked outer membrane protein n=1 Tax=Marivirga sp. TaxID=2018662 RepID=UPI0025F3F5DA|nr:TonB-dependent receptor [Marivirga sp.]
MKKILLTCFMLVFVLYAWAQDRTVSGTVTDAETGEALPGVNVLLKGTGTGITTDLDGNYKISVPSDGGTLVFTFIGMEKVEVNIGARSVIDVQMETDVEQLSEVIVTGYGSVKRADLTSSISTVSGEDLQSIPIAGIDNLLQGKSPGVQVINQNGAPGANAYIRVRGVGSVNASNEPLFIIDGIQLTSVQYNAINPNDIQDISILKDAAATSIYGARASNGVVLVTTKDGSRTKKPQVTYKYQMGAKEMIPNNFEMMNKEEKLRYEVEVGLRDEASAEELRNSLAAPDTDWFDVLLRRGSVQSHDLSFSGNGEKSKYFFSFGTYDEEGISVGSKFSRITGRANTEFKLTDFLSFGNNLTVTNSTNNQTRDRNNVQNPFRAIYDYNPYEPEFILDEEGNKELDENGDPIYNPTRQGFSIGEALRKNPEEEKYTNAIGNVYLSADPIEGLRIKSVAGINYRLRNREYYIMPGSILDGYVGDPAAPGIKTDNNDVRNQFNWTNTVNYNFSPVEGHIIDVLGGTELITADIRTSRISSKGFPSENFTTHDNASEVTAGNTTRDQWALWSQFGQVSYNLNEKYFATGSIRRDGSSRFGADQKYGIFWATSAGWNIHDESFLDFDFLSQFKIRGSVGTSGNVPNELYASRGFYGFGSYNNTVTRVPTQLENKDLKWEENFNYSVGVDFGVFNNRFSGSVDYYTRNTRDLLFNRPVSRTTGWTSRLENIGEIVNTGIEVELAYDIVRSRDFNFTLLGSVATNDNEVLNLDNGGEDIVDAFTLLSEGSKVNTFYLVRYAGVNPANGEELFYNKDGEITNSWSGDDAVALDGKTPLPTYFGNFGFNTSYKGLALNVNFYYQGGNYVYNIAYNSQQLANGNNAARSNQRVDAFNYWKEPGDVDVLPRPGVDVPTFTSDRYLQRADFIRLRNVNLSYSLPKSILDKIKLQGIQVFVQGTNLWTFNPFFDGDPEVGRGSAESGLTQLGEVTLYTFPNTRGATAGLNITF